MSQWKDRYRDARSEADVSDILAEELAACGLVVRREVNCVMPLDGSGGKDQSRRIDLWATRPASAALASPVTHSDGEVRTLGSGGVVGVELKFEPDRRRWKLWRTCFEQAKSAMRSHDYWIVPPKDGRQVALPRPTVMLCADNWTLSGEATETELGEMDRALWANGAAVLYREPITGGLYWRMHVGRQDVRVHLRSTDGER